jgi:hypothetical protein
MVVRTSSRRRKDNAETLRALRFAEKAKRKSEKKKFNTEVTEDRAQRSQRREEMALGKNNAETLSASFRTSWGAAVRREKAKAPATVRGRYGCKCIGGANTLG